MLSLGTIRLTAGFLGALPGTVSVYLCRADLAAPDYLSRFGAHGDITATIATAGNATRI
jgi:hypothetical protein